MTNSKSTVSRRLFLKGTGVAMSLPWLESLPVWGREAAAQPPQRFAALFMGNGVHQTEWYAKGAGKEIEFGNCLKPLEPLKEKVNVISGLFNKNATGEPISNTLPLEPDAYAVRERIDANTICNADIYM